MIILLILAAIALVLGVVFTIRGVEEDNHYHLTGYKNHSFDYFKWASITMFFGLVLFTVILRYSSIEP